MVAFDEGHTKLSSTAFIYIYIFHMHMYGHIAIVMYVPFDGCFYSEVPELSDSYTLIGSCRKSKINISSDTETEPN